jgi:hypothetical protein
MVFEPLKLPSRVLLDSGFKQKVKKARGNQGKIFIFVRKKKHPFAKLTCLTYSTQKMDGLCRNCL